MNIKEIKDLIKLIDDSQLAEVEIENEGFKLSVRRYPNVSAAVTGMQPMALAPMHHGHASNVTLQAQAPAPVPAVIEGAETDNAPDNQVVIVSPMVGTFYRCPSPGSPAFAEVGQTISKGQVVCIIEAMKLMNEIESEYSGRIVKLLAEDAQPVEYGQPLFILESV